MEDIFKWAALGLVVVGVAVVIRIIRQANRERAAAIARIEASRRADQSFKDAWFALRNKGVVHRPPPPRHGKSSAVGKAPSSAVVGDHGMTASQMGLMSGGSWPSPSPAASYSGGGGTFDGGGSSGDWSSSSSSSDSSSSSSSDSGGGSSSSD